MLPNEERMFVGEQQATASNILRGETDDGTTVRIV
jgi:hypothetical protein